MAPPRATAQSGPNGRAIKTAPEPPPNIRIGRWFEIGQCYSGTVTKVGTHVFQDDPDTAYTELTLELDAPAVTLYKNERFNLEAGAELVLTITQTHLIPQIEALDPQPGLWLRITWTDMRGRMNIYRVEYDDSDVVRKPSGPTKIIRDDQPAPF